MNKFYIPVIVICFSLFGASCKKCELKKDDAFKPVIVDYAINDEHGSSYVWAGDNIPLDLHFVDDWELKRAYISASLVYQGVMPVSDTVQVFNEESRIILNDKEYEEVYNLTVPFNASAGKYWLNCYVDDHNKNNSESKSLMIQVENALMATVDIDSNFAQYTIGKDNGFFGLVEDDDDIFMVNIYIYNYYNSNTVIYEKTIDLRNSVEAIYEIKEDIYVSAKTEKGTYVFEVEVIDSDGNISYGYHTANFL